MRALQKCFEKFYHKALLDIIGLSGKYRKHFQIWGEASVFDYAVDFYEGTTQPGLFLPLS
jgi:hypothetical protein